jgi:hypothetical protein
MLKFRDVLSRWERRELSMMEAGELLGMYRTHYRGWNVKHFHEQGMRDHKFAWGYTWTKTQLHAAGLAERAKRHGAHRRPTAPPAWRNWDLASLVMTVPIRSAWLAGSAQTGMDLPVQTSRIVCARPCSCCTKIMQVGSGG